MKDAVQKEAVDLYSFFAGSNSGSQSDLNLLSDVLEE